ncbi:MAG TPA: hypothetical protein VMF50_06070 [Candidatus Binataceae bacterium]|nr:hypothetical protein [Candidatus Binataceae bacterium]
MRKLIFFAVLAIVAAALPDRTLEAQVCDQGTDLARPIELGSAGGNINLSQTNSQGIVTGCCSGTLGALVQGPGGKYILSNNHVLARVNLGKPGEGIIQPGLIQFGCPDSPPTEDIVAHLSAAAHINFAANGKNQIDAAIAHIVSGDVSPDILNIGPISNKVAPAVINMAVQKMGATTCLTQGIVQSINVDAIGSNGVEYTDECNSASGTANFVDQIVVKPSSGVFTAPGDSGSLVVTTGACPRPVGLLFASDASGNAYVNPIRKVLNHFGVSFVAGCTAASTAANADTAATGDSVSGDSADSEAAGFMRISGISLDAVNYATAIKARHEKDLFAVPGVAAVGIGASEEPGVPSIDVYVTEDSPALRAAIPDNLEGAPVKVIVGGPIHAL